MHKADLVSAQARECHRRWLLEVTQIPTAAGRESRVIAWIEAFVRERPDVVLSRDPAGNLVLRLAADANPAAPALYFTAHLDHPAFVVESVDDASEFIVSFRGGVMDDYFKDARIDLFDAADTRHPAALLGEAAAGDSAFKHYRCRTDRPASTLRPGDVGVWALPAAHISEGLVHTPACDDLAAAVAALAAFDELRASPPASASAMPVRLLFTRAEEIGFVGAIAATRHATMPKGSRVIALENSRSFSDSPIGAGPIVRVGDRLSIFSPALTDAVARRAQDLGGPQPTARDKIKPGAWRWQRKLMAGGACEASVFCEAGYEATCVCLPLGNYHNMADLDAVQAGTNTTPPRVGLEFISLADFEGMVDLLIACGNHLPHAAPKAPLFDSLFDKGRQVLEA